MAAFCTLFEKYEQIIVDFCSAVVFTFFHGFDFISGNGMGYFLARF